MSISLLTGSGGNPLPNSASAAAKKSDDASHVYNIPTSGDEKAATSLTLSQDTQLIAPPEANGNVDEGARSRSNIESALVAELEAQAEAAEPEADTDEDARDDAMKSDQAKQAYEAAMRGPITVLAEAAAGTVDTQQDPLASDQGAQPALSMVA